jgi:prevent-host-death family protein
MGSGEWQHGDRTENAESILAGEWRNLRCIDQIPTLAPVIVDADEAQPRLPELLDRVEQGEVVVITRNDRAVARLVAGLGHDVAKARAAVEQLTALRKELAARGVHLTQEEIRAMRDEGRR